jgi:hypothetical protein
MDPTAGLDRFEVPLPGIEPQVLRCPASSPLTKLTELTELQHDRRNRQRLPICNP